MHRILCSRANKVVETWECDPVEGWNCTSAVPEFPSTPVVVRPLHAMNAHVTFCQRGEICITDADASSPAGNRAKYYVKAVLKRAEASGEGAQSATDGPVELDEHTLKSRNWKTIATSPDYVAERRISCGELCESGTVVASGG